QHARPQCGEVVDGAGQGLLEAVEAVSCRKVDDGLIGFEPPVVFEPLQDAGEQVQLRERICEAPGELLLRLEAAAQQRDAQIGDEREIVTGSPELAEPGLDPERLRRRRSDQAAGDVVEEGTKDIGDAERDVIEENRLERREAPLRIGILRSLYLA